MKYTVKELIKTLEECPQDFVIEVFNSKTATVEKFETVGIDNNEKKVTFFLNY